MQHNHNVLLLICAQSLPLTLIDSSHWKKTINHLDAKLDHASGSHLASTLIPLEAALIHQKSTQLLRTYTNLTLSFDRATTQHNQSIYTVHVVVNSTKTPELIPIFLDFFRRLYAPILSHVTSALIPAKSPL
jgi:glycine cleavage system regulatory protein